jgi:hypothetical protein
LEVSPQQQISAAVAGQIDISNTGPAMLGRHINCCEDSQTAAIFTHLLHLPTEVFWKILRNACDGLPEYPGELLNVEPWPNWDAAGTRNTHRVVPDLFMRFAVFDLIIEAKRWDDGRQYFGQWESELISYTNEYGQEKREVRFIALGGLHSDHDELRYLWPSAPPSERVSAKEDTHLFVCPVHMCRWQSLLHQCKRMEQELQRIEYQTSQSCAHHRILLDLIDLFSWHGFQTGVWFADVAADPKRPRLGPFVASHHLTFQGMFRLHPG